MPFMCLTNASGNSTNSSHAVVKVISLDWTRVSDIKRWNNKKSARTRNKENSATQADEKNLLSL